MRRFNWVVLGMAAIVCFACKGNEGGKTVAGSEGVRPTPKIAGNEGVHPAPAQIAGKVGIPPGRGDSGAKPKAALASVTH